MRNSELDLSAFARDLIKIFGVPSTIQAQIIESTDTVYERNQAIITICLFKFLKDTTGLDNADELLYFMHRNRKELIEQFALTVVAMKLADNIKNECGECHLSIGEKCDICGATRD